jgi:hypothetical protein
LKVRHGKCVDIRNPILQEEEILNFEVSLRAADTKCML